MARSVTSACGCCRQIEANMPKPQPTLAKIARPRIRGAVARERLFAVIKPALTLPRAS